MKKMNAITLRNLLTFLLVLVILLAGAGFYYAYGQIKTYATTVNQAVVSAHSSATPTTSVNTQALEAALAKETTVTSTLAKFYAPSATFQTQAIQDVTKYAQDSNLSIGDVSTGTGDVTSGLPTVTVTLKAPTSYTSLLKFMTYIQNNLPKMQVQGVSIQHKNGGGSDTVTIATLTIEVVTQ